MLTSFASRGFSQKQILSSKNISTRNPTSPRTKQRKQYSGYGAPAVHDDHHVAHKVHEVKPLLTQFHEKDTALYESYKSFVEKYNVKPKKVGESKTDLVDVALLSQPVLECLAEINATEFKHSLDGVTLSQVYEEQREKFEKETLDVLFKAGVPIQLIEVLHDIYQVRSNVDVIEIQVGVRSLKFLKKDERKKFRITYGVDGPRTQLRYDTLRTYIKNLLGSRDEDLYNLYENSHQGEYGEAGSNEDQARFNIKRLRSVQGFLKAAQKGITEPQLLEIKKILTIPNDEEITLIKNMISRISVLAESAQEAAVLLKGICDTFPPNTTAYLYAVKLISEELKRPSEEAKREQEKKEIFSILQERLAETKKNNPSGVKVAEALVKAITTAAEPKNMKLLETVSLLETIRMTPEQQDRVLKIFESDDTFSDELLNDVANPHPLANYLWGDRMMIMSLPRINYTKKFQEGSGSSYPDFHEDPAFGMSWENNVYLSECPAPNIQPFQFGIEKAFHAKLDRLADILGFEFNSDYNLGEFQNFLTEYDVSPGEPTLERIHDYPPATHTYDELPIIKSDEYDEFTPVDYAEEMTKYELAKKEEKKELFEPNQLVPLTFEVAEANRLKELLKNPNFRKKMEDTFFQDRAVEKMKLNLFS